MHSHNHIHGNSPNRKSVNKKRPESECFQALKRTCKGASTQEYLSGIVDCQNGLAFGAAKPSGLRCLELFGTDGASENLGKHFGFDFDPARLEEIDGIGKRILDIEKLGKTQELENFVHFRLDFEQDDIAAFRLDGFKEGSKRTDTGGRHIIEGAAIENKPVVPCFDDL